MPPEGLWDSLCAVRPEDGVIIYLSGHGGGRNFGGGACSLTREALAAGLSRLRCRELLVVVDCCWSGEFALSFTGVPGTLITSTDATHLAPFPTSFLAPVSFGRTFFANYEGNAERALVATNQARQRWAWCYPKEFGLSGTRTTSPPSP